MPQKYSIKTYVEGGIYHVYNRGVEKRIIFEEEVDYKVFLKYLKEYLSRPVDKMKLFTIVTLQGESFQGIPHQPKNYHKKVDLFAYCLMPNHFHLMVKQENRNHMERFMRSLATRYSVYFNRKYKRVGSLFQGPYKAVRVKDDAYLLHLSRYIHLNPLVRSSNLTKAYSSYADYLGLRKTKWVKPEMILKFFNTSFIPEIKKHNTYKDFVENYKQDSKTILGKLTLED